MGLPVRVSTNASRTDRMLISICGSRRCVNGLWLSARSACTPSGIVTPMTRRSPSASAQSAAATLESLPPDMPITAAAFGVFCAK